MPFYLWDSLSKRTVVANTLEDSPTCKCISYPRGSWRIKNAAFDIECVPWLVSAKTRSNIRTLLDLFLEKVWTNPTYRSTSSGRLRVRNHRNWPPTHHLSECESGCGVDQWNYRLG